MKVLILKHTKKTIEELDWIEKKKRNLSKQPRSSPKNLNNNDPSAWVWQVLEKNEIVE